jgi:hypothetical protein
MAPVTEADGCGGIGGGEQRAHVLAQQVACAAVERVGDKEVARATRAVERRGPERERERSGRLQPPLSDPRPPETARAPSPPRQSAVAAGPKRRARWVLASPTASSGRTVTHC